MVILLVEMSRACQIYFYTERA